MDKLLKNKKILFLIVVFQEAFTAIIPFFFLSAIFTLVYYLFKSFNLAQDLQSLAILKNSFNTFTSLAAVISISYFLAKRLTISRITSILLSIATFLSVILIETPSFPPKLPYGFTIQTLIIPIASTFTLYLLYPKLSLNLPLDNSNKHIYRLFNYFFAFLVSYFLVVLAYFAIDYQLDKLFEVTITLLDKVPLFLQLLIRDFLRQIFWFIGIHGPHMVNALFGKEFLSYELFKNLTTSEFNRLFVVLGGSGIGLALLIAIFLVVKDKNYRFLAKISTPFVFFNINTLLIYPFVVLNRFLFTPFVFLPLLNAILGYLFVILADIKFTSNYIAWTTPPFFNAYIKTQDFRVILFQIFLIVIDTIVYIKYIKKFIQATKYPKSILQENLNIQKDLKAKDIIKSFAAQKEIIEKSAKLYEFLPTLTEKNLFIYYQPKVNIKNKTCTNFEALIRYNHQGKLTGPIFLDVIEKAGLAPVIDLWVVKKVKEDILKWKKENFYPTISVNLHPDTLADTQTINEIIKILNKENIVIEIIERSFFQDKTSIENFKRLKKHFKIAIDDFGVGYSNFETLLKYKIDELKIDKAIIDHILTKEGYIICKNITDICHNLNIEVVAEGVENKEQLQKVKEIGVDLVQGYYFSAAIPFEKVKEFSSSLAKILQ